MLTGIANQKNANDGQGMNILLIETNQDLGESLAQALRGDGHCVEWRSAQQKNEDAHHDGFDLVIDSLEGINPTASENNAQEKFPDWVRTSLRAARQSIEAANAELEHEKRISEYRKRLAANLSHELKTPIAAILTTAQTMLSHERTSDRYKQALRLCERNARSMSQLIRRMLDLAKAGSDAWRPTLSLVNARELLEASIDLHTPQAQDDGVELLLVCRSGQLIQSDTDLLLIMVNNLLGNAIRYTRRGKSVVIRFSPPTQETGATISVIDQGPGIRPEVLPHIFEAFYQDDAVRGAKHAYTANYGLGLALTAELAERLDIDIQVESEPGGGASFHLILPLASVDADR